MRPRYFIFSLPRSGTSWLSLFLSGPDSYCYHEPTADHRPEEWCVLAREREERIVGAVDTGAMYFPELIWDALPTTNFYCLYRSPYEVQRSMRWNHLEFNAFTEIEKLKALRHEPILYSKFDDIGYLEEVWARVIGTRFDTERARMFMEMRVERDVQKFFCNRPNAAEHARSMIQ